MERSTELRKVKRGLWRELMYRSDWLFYGLIATILLACIPVVGWFLAVGVVLATLWKVCGFRESQLIGDCPACTKQIPITPDMDVSACPVCHNVVAVRENRLVVLDVY